MENICLHTGGENAFLASLKSLYTQLIKKINKNPLFSETDKQEERRKVIEYIREKKKNSKGNCY